ncbi:hypothetical protein [uncultured Pseudacidovorax sp.]|uniref:hypothetical protein n=1 Tax=uncultured Pseudacidovorax sp. TaxID=679313 RepID=UPI0025DCDBC6|nr:hypothetical protein [uncultured Pseudacidovorax sp.]
MKRDTLILLACAGVAAFVLLRKKSGGDAATTKPAIVWPSSGGTGTVNAGTLGTTATAPAADEAGTEIGYTAGGQALGWSGPLRVDASAADPFTQILSWFGPLKGEASAA